MREKNSDEAKNKFTRVASAFDGLGLTILAQLTIRNFRKNQPTPIPLPGFNANPDESKIPILKIELTPSLPRHTQSQEKQAELLPMPKIDGETK